MTTIKDINKTIAEINKTTSGMKGGLQQLSTLPEETSSEPTVSDMYSNIPQGSGSSSMTQDEFNKQFEVDEAGIRSNVISRYQDEVNAAKNAYASLLADTKKQGQGRLGETTAMSARRGLLGSDFGTSSLEATRKYNLGQEQGVLESQATAIANIMARANQEASDEIANRRNAKLSGYTAYKTYQEEAKTRKAENLKNLASSFILQNLNPQNMTQDQLKKLAGSYGVTTQEILNSYLTEKDTRDKESAKESKPFEAGGYMYQYNPTTGKYESKGTQAYKPTDTSLTTYQQFQATQSIAKDNQKRTENAREMSRQAQLIQSSYNNIINNKGDRSLNTQAIVTAFNKILDPTSVVRESEYDRTAEGQSLINRLQGAVENIVTGGAGVTEDTLKAASDIAATYLANSQASIKAENDRAILMANQFGLNPNFVTTTNQGQGTASNKVVGPDGKEYEFTD